jgi:hypothetical protein
VSASAVLDRALAYHGMPAWEAASTIGAHVRVGGMAFRLPGRSALDMTGVASTREPRTEIRGFGGAGRVGTFTPGRVWIDEHGTTVAARSDPRAHFGLRTQVKWDDLDVLYFCGYALWGYLNQPFMLTWPGVSVRETGPGRLEATFPDDMPVHSRRQAFVFDESSGRLEHLEYTADVFGPWARCVHRCWDDEPFGGLRYATRRRVVPRLAGRALPGPTIVSIAMDSIEAAG